MQKEVGDGTDVSRKRVVVIGGGTGTFTVLSGLKKHPFDLTAVVTMADDGGSTGRLRDEFGVLPPGDLRQGLVALSEADMIMRRLFNHRYKSGGLAGHNFGNIFISTLEQITGSLDAALDVVGKVLNIKGAVLPVTLSKVTLLTELENGTIIDGEDALGECQDLFTIGVKNISLTPRPRANPKALKAIKSADLIIVGPGDLYTSLLPNFLVPGIGRALIQAQGKKVYVANLMNKTGHTDHMTVLDYVRVLEKTLGKENVFDAIVYNTKRPPAHLLRKYADEGSPVFCGGDGSQGNADLIGVPLLANGVARRVKGDTLRRTLIRHDPDKLATVLSGLL